MKLKKKNEIFIHEHSTVFKFGVTKNEMGLMLSPIPKRWEKKPQIPSWSSKNLISHFVRIYCWAGHANTGFI